MTTWSVIPAEAESRSAPDDWMPAFEGMTGPQRG